MALRGTKISTELCLLSCAWKDYPALEQILHTPFETQECHRYLNAYPVSQQKKLLTLRIVQYQLSSSLHSSNQGTV